MRTKKQIRQGVKNRIITGYILMIVAAILLTLGYLALEYDFVVVRILKENFTSTTILVLVSIVWFAVATALFISGMLVIYFRAIRHHEYVERPHSSEV